MKNEIKAQKLFNIHYNKKVFTIFLCENGRKTFLELSNGKYNYPLLNDFLNLNKIYNEKDYTTMYSNNINSPLLYPKKYKFREAVVNITRGISAVLVVLTTFEATSFLLKGKTYEVEINNNELQIKTKYSNNIYFDDSQKLDKNLGKESIPLDEVINAINNNDNLEEKYKECAIKLAKYINMKYPLTDNRIFYDNIKNMRIKKLPDNIIYKHIVGIYEVDYNIIKIKEKWNSNEEVILHELAHSYHHWCSKNDLVGKYRTTILGSSLNEAMTNKVISGITDVTTYRREGKILDYLLTLVNYNYYDYEQGGITKLYNMLKEKYPIADIDYIFNCSDAMCDTEINTGENIKIEETPEFLDAMFNLCIESINQDDNLYIHILNFLNLIDCKSYPSIAENYINKYNIILKEMNKDITISNDIIKDSKNINKYLVDFKNYLFNSEYKYPKNDKSKKEMYEQFNDYLNSNNNFISNYDKNILINIFSEMLDLYNNYLISNGYEKEHLITKEQFFSKFSNYLNIIIKGYCVTKDDEIYLIIDIPENNKLYNQKTRIPVLDKEGKITLISIEDIVMTGDINNEKYQYQFISYIFNNLVNNKKYNINELLTNYFQISPFKYQKISLNINGNEITTDYLKNLNVIIGENIDGTNSFKLTDKKGRIIYETENSSSKFVTLDFYDYVKYFIDSPFIELTDYLSTNYLIDLLNYGDFEMTNKEYLKVDGNKITIENQYFAIINNNKINLNNINLILTKNLDNTTSNAQIIINQNLISSQEYPYLNIDSLLICNLKQVLIYYNILDDNNCVYNLTEENIINLFDNYIKDEISRKEYQKTYFK